MINSINDLNIYSNDYQQAQQWFNPDTEHRESFLGGHFISLYQECPWKFFLKYILGYIKPTEQRYFVRGQALHSGIEHYLTSSVKNPDITQLIPLAYMNMHRDEITETFNDDIELVLMMITEWIDQYHTQDPDNLYYEEVECEQQHIITLSNGFPITVRLDRLVRSKTTGRLIVIDTKTTKNNMSNVIQSMTMDNQGLMYLYAVEQIYGEKPAGIIVDIIQGKLLKYRKEANVFRSKLITFSNYAYLQWEMNIIGLLSEIAQKTKTFYDNALPPEFLFPRSANKCSFMGCEYSDICRRHPSYDKIPPGYSRDPWTDQHKLKDIVLDPSYIDKLLYEMTVHNNLISKETEEG